MKKKSVGEEAEKIINGPRRASYGPVDESFNRVAKAWTGVLADVLKKDLTPRQVALCMIALKICREANKSHRDNRVDIAGYNLLLDKLSQ